MIPKAHKCFVVNVSLSSMLRVQELFETIEDVGLPQGEVTTLK